MSAFFSWQQAILKSSLEPTTRLVCLTIGCHMALDGSGCFPSYAKIADESGLGRRTVIDHVQKAVDAGYLTLEHRERENGSSTSNLYQPTMPVVQELHQGGATAALGVVQELHPHNTPSLTPQLSEPSVSPTTKATKRATLPLRSLEEFLEPTGGTASEEFGDYASKLGWDGERAGRVWVKFERSGKALTQRAEVGSETGSALGRTGVTEKPRTAEEAAAMALALVGGSLPPCVQAFLHATEQHSLVAMSVGGRAPTLPVLTVEEHQVVSQVEKLLSEILQPARERGPELEVAIGGLMAVMNVFTGDQAKLSLQVSEWCQYLGDYPLYAIRKAAKWTVTSRDKLPSVAAFINDVKLAIGSGVLERQRLLGGLLRSNLAVPGR
jgi:hypothetical protein